MARSAIPGGIARKAAIVATAGHIVLTLPRLRHHGSTLPDFETLSLISRVSPHRSEPHTLPHQPTTNLVEDADELLIGSVVDYAIYMLDPYGHVMTWNPGAQRVKGYTADEIIGHHFSRFYTPEDRAAGLPERALKTAAETGRFAA